MSQPRDFFKRLVRWELASLIICTALLSHPHHQVVQAALASPISKPIGASTTAPSHWSTTGSLHTGRDGHTATLLSNGQVLVAGGNNRDYFNQSGGTLSSAELYDPAMGIWTITGSLNTPREAHTATLLPTGKVLVAGGRNGNTTLDSAELYDPSTGTWTNTGNLNYPIADHKAVLLQTGKVLVVAGVNELYDPATGTWSQTGSPNFNPLGSTATLLADGRVLAAGGSAALYNPSTGTWGATGSMSTDRTYHTATLLLNGKVLVAGGANVNGFLNSAELYDPTTGGWTVTGHLFYVRARHTATLLPGGQVLVAGGYDGSGYNPATSEIYDPVLGEWFGGFGGDAMSTARGGPTATLLANGQVLVVGGTLGQNVLQKLASAELYNPCLDPTSITTQPNSLTACVGATAQFTALTTGEGNHYQWRKNGVALTDGGNIHILGAQLTINPVAVADAGSYDLVVTGYCGTVTSTPATLTVSMMSPSAIITAPSAVISASTGNTASVPDAGPGATYSWTITNGTITAGAGTPSITFTAGGAGSLTLNVTVQTSGGCTASGTQNVAINPPCTYSLSPTSQSFGEDSGTGSVMVMAPAYCSWSASSDAGWMTITAGGSGNGNGTVSYQVSAYSGNSPRTGTLAIAGQTFTVTQIRRVVNLSAASYSGMTLARESIIAAFGRSLATSTKAASAGPLPYVLAGTTVQIKDHSGSERLAPLFFVSPLQINYQIPPGTVVGQATVTITSGAGTVSMETIQLGDVAPGLFAANSNGQGVAAAVALRVKTDNSQTYEPVAQFDGTQYVSRPIDLGPEDDVVYLILFGTGVRGSGSLEGVSVKIGGVDSPVSYAGVAPGFVGLDQVNVYLLRSLIGRGEVDVVLTVNGQTANTVKVNIK